MVEDPGGSGIGKASLLRLPYAAALGLACGLYALPSIRDAFPLTACALAGAGIAARVHHGHGTRQGAWGARLVAAALGLALGWGLLLGMEAKKGGAGLGFADGALEGFIALEGYLAEDGRDVKGERRLLPIELEWSEGRSGRALARGRLLLFLDGIDLEGKDTQGAMFRISLGSKGAAAIKAEDGVFLLSASSEDMEFLGWRTPLDRIRNLARRSVLAGAERLCGGSAGFFKALLFGVKDDLDSEDAAAFAEAGCQHVLALSGQHLGILAALIAFFLSRLVGKRGAAILSLAGVIAYVLLVGAQASLLRAVAMYAFSAAALLAGRKGDGLCALSAAFIAMAAIDPESAYSLSFTLSFLAIWGLILLSPRYAFILSRWLPPKIAEALSASLAAFAFTAPFCILAFGTLKPAGILATLASAPSVVVFMWSGLILLPLVSIFPAIGALTAPAMDIQYGILRKTMELGAALPGLEGVSGGAALVVAAVLVLAAALLYASPYAPIGRLAARAFPSARPPRRARP